MHILTTYDQINFYATFLPFTHTYFTRLNNHAPPNVTWQVNAALIVETISYLSHRLIRPTNK